MKSFLKIIALAAICLVISAAITAPFWSWAVHSHKTFSLAVTAVTIGLILFFIVKKIIKSVRQKKESL